MDKQEIIIGKYTLESLTNGMYASPLDLYREYIQNAVDSIDEGVMKNYFKNEDAVIEINIDKKEKSIKIKDNGVGIEKELAANRLTDIGNSQKNRLMSRGFRGIGRLAGLGYCKSLVFTTSCIGEQYKTIVKFDAKELSSLLMDKNSELNSANQVLERVISVKYEQEKCKSHYFSVELIGVTNVDKLLDIDIVEDYLVQYAPLKYNKEFKWQSPILEKMKSLGYIVPSYEISLNGKHLYKPYTDTFISDRVKKIDDLIKDIEVMPFYRNGKISAILWCAKSNFFGTIIKNTIKGIRIRQGNILIGDKTSCNSLFKEERFNGWLSCFLIFLTFRNMVRIFHTPEGIQ